MTIEINSSPLTKWEDRDFVIAPAKHTSGLGWIAGFAIFLDGGYGYSFHTTAKDAIEFADYLIERGYLKPYRPSQANPVPELERCIGCDKMKVKES